ncbi:hypothetical protein wScaTNS_12490 [Wolbachia pipientis]|nr:hypothetical protein wHmt_14200 [Wolbachia pipientis]BDG78164.1 hypothetical protein wHmc_12960 [Wolbachia pipientis]
MHIEIIPSIRVVLLVNNKITRAIDSNSESKAKACFMFNAPLASGLYFVRSTCASISLSKISLIMHPAGLIKNAPIVNKTRRKRA